MRKVSLDMALLITAVSTPFRARQSVPVQRVLPRCGEAKFGGAEGAPRDAVAGIVQAAERALPMQNVLYAASHWR